MRSDKIRPSSAVTGCPTCQARIICPFANLEPEILGHFRAIAQMRFHQCGDILLRQGEAVPGVFVVRSGCVKLVHFTPLGKAVTAGLPGPGSVLGLGEVLTGGVSQLTAEAFQPSNLEYLPKTEFLRLLYANPASAVELLKAASFELRRIMGELHNLMGKVPPAERLLHTLRDLSQTCGRPTPDGVQLGLPLTGQMLADRIGCSRQWVCGLLSDLERQGMIRRTKGWIRLTRGALAR